MTPGGRGRLWCGGLLVAGVLAAYSNHFNNAFQLDDSHTVVSNPAIRSVSNIPHFFATATTFSSSYWGRSYRPLVSTSLAIDYALCGGLNPVCFHVSTFCWFLIQLAFMYALFVHIFAQRAPHPWSPWCAFLAVAVYALHPVSAETVNYIIQRGDLYAALGIVSSLAVYALAPAWRHYGIYLLPALAAMLSKPTGLIFAPIALVYIVLIERRDDEPIASCVLRTIPAFALTAALGIVQATVTPKNFFHTSMPSVDYWITQPYVTLRYVIRFFVPLQLSADTDLEPFTSPWSTAAIGGYSFCALLIGAAVHSGRRGEWRVVSFGLWWFLLALLPTAIYPLNEVENTHRMFLPFVGLSLAVVGAGGLLLGRLEPGPWCKSAVVGSMVVCLAWLAWETHRRNEVWRTPESLWGDVLEKSPKNPRAHVFFGEAHAKRGQWDEAISEYRKAQALIPPYDYLGHMSLGLAWRAIPGHVEDAIAECGAAVHISPDSAAAHLDFGDVLAEVPARLPEAIEQYEAALRSNPDYATAHNNLALALSNTPGRLGDAIAEYEVALELEPEVAETHLNLGDALVRIPNRTSDAVEQYRAALRINPDYAVAHNNLGVTYAKMPNRSADAIKEFEAAVRIDPEAVEFQKNLRAAKERAQAGQGSADSTVVSK